MVNGEGSTRGILTSAAPLEGPLKLRKTGIGSKWSKRWFVLEGQSLHYYRRRPVNEKDIAVGSVNLWDVKDVTIVDADISVRFNDTQAGFRSAGMSHKSLGETAWRYATLRKSVPEADIALQLRCKDSNEAQMWVNGMFSTALKGQAQRASTEEGGIRKLVPLRFKDPDTKLQTTLPIDISLKAIKVVNKETRKLSHTISGLSKNMQPAGCVRYDEFPTHFFRIEYTLPWEKHLLTVNSNCLMRYFDPEETEFEVKACGAKLGGNVIRIRMQKGGEYLSSRLARNLTQNFDAAVYCAAFGCLVAGIVTKSFNVCVLLVCFAFASMHALEAVASVYKAEEGYHVVSVFIMEEHKLAPDFDQGSVDDEEEKEKGAQEAVITEEEVALLAKLRSNMEDLPEEGADRATRVEYEEFLSTDYKLVRFLRARDHKLDQAEKMFRAALKWRIEYGAKDLHKTYTPPQWLLDYLGCPMFTRTMHLDSSARQDWYFRDKRGHLTMYVRSGGVDWKRVYKKLGEDGEALFRAGVWILEKTQADLNHNYLISGRKVGSQVTLVFDLKGFKLSQQIPVNQAVGLARKYLNRILDAYPEILAHVVIVNAPWLFLSIWNMFKPFFPKDIVENKIKIYGSKHIDEKILALIPRNQVPALYGGLLEEDGDPTCPDRIPSYGPHTPSKGVELIK